jgi:hypothetical protein
LDKNDVIRSATAVYIPSDEISVIMPDTAFAKHSRYGDAHVLILPFRVLEGFCFAPLKNHTLSD